MRVDMDEFWYAEKGNIREYLAGLTEDVTSVQVVWQMLCSNGAFLKHPNSLINAYIETTANGRGREEKARGGGSYKTLAKTSEIASVGCHTIETRSGRNLELTPPKSESDFQGLRLNHYRSQSKKYFLKVQVPRAKQNSLLRRETPTDKYREEMFGVLDPPDGGENTTLRNKRNSHTEWMAKSIAERGIWPAA